MTSSVDTHPYQNEPGKSPTFLAIREYFESSEFIYPPSILEDYVRIICPTKSCDLDVCVDALEEEGIRVIKIASNAGLRFPLSSIEALEGALRIINSCSVDTRVSIFEYDESLSIFTNVEFRRDVTPREIEEALGAHLRVADRCIGPLIRVGFNGAPLNEIKDLFCIPKKNSTFDIERPG